MKHQQITVDVTGMVFTACSYLALAGAVWIFLRLLQACFWLPRQLKKQNDVQQMLQDKVDSYEKYILECEEKERSMTREESDEGEIAEEKNVENSEKWKERRECLEMLKRELKRIREGGDMNDWDYLLEEENPKNGEATTTENQDDEKSKEENAKEEDKKENIKEEEKNEIETEEKKEK